MAAVIWKSIWRCLDWVYRSVNRKRTFDNRKDCGQSLNSNLHRTRGLFTVCILCILVWIGTQPTLAQTGFRTGSETAAIVLDGKPLFEVQSFQNFSAKKRAKQVNFTLAKSLLAPPSRLSVEVVPQNNVLTLQLMQPEPQYLLTITEADLVPGLDAMVQAEDWRRTLNTAIETAQRERTPTYVRQTFLRCLLLALIATLIHLCMRGGKRYGKRLKTASMNRRALPKWVDARFLSLALLGVQATLWIGLFFYISNQFPLLRQWRYSFLNNIATQPLFSLNKQPYSAIDLLVFGALLVGLWLVVRSLTLLLRSRILNVFGVPRGLQEAISILTQYILTSLGLVLILQALGIDISSILILGSALGVGIGFGLQNIVNNFISGIILLLERPMEVGNFVKVGELLGTVERIGARSTEIQTLDQVTIIVPNSHFVEKEVVNWDYGNPVSRLRIPVGVAYGVDIDLVRQVLLTAVGDHPSVLAYPKPQVWMKGFGDFAIEFDVLIWLLKPREQFRLQSDLYYRIEAALREAQIEIPFPQQDLHLRSPQLNQLLTYLQEQYPVSKPSGLIYPKQNNAETHPIPQRSSKVKRSKIKPTALPSLDYQALTCRMRGEKGIDIRDRRHRLNLYPQCFIGSEAVDWLMTDQQISRASAVNLGQVLIDRGLIHHVLDEHPFKDAFLFYRFFEDERTVSPLLD